MSGWFQNARLEWARESIEIFGFLNRRHLMAKFGISEPQAAADLKRARARWPDHFHYNPKAKRFERGGKS